MQIKLKHLLPSSQILARWKKIEMKESEAKPNLSEEAVPTARKEEPITYIT